MNENTSLFDKIINIGVYANDFLCKFRWTDSFFQKRRPSKTIQPEKSFAQTNNDGFRDRIDYYRSVLHPSSDTSLLPDNDGGRLYLLAMLNILLCTCSFLGSSHSKTLDKKVPKLFRHLYQSFIHQEKDDFLHSIENRRSSSYR